MKTLQSLQDVQSPKILYDSIESEINKVLDRDLKDH